MAAAQVQRDLAGQRDVPSVLGDQQPARQQAVDRSGLVAATHRPVGGLDGTVAALPVEVLEDRAGAVIDLGQQLRHPFRVGEDCPDRGDVGGAVAGGLQPEIARQRGHPARPVAAEQQLHVRPEPAHRGAEGVGEHAQRPEVLVVAPDQRDGLQVVQRRVDRRRVGVHQLPDTPARRRTTGGDDGVEDGELELVELVDGAQR